jgi:hypothetical protein
MKDGSGVIDSDLAQRLVIRGISNFAAVQPVSFGGGAASGLF